MSAFQILTFATQQALDTAANVLSGATMTFTLTGTSTPTNAYADKDLTTPLANPLSADAAGNFVSVFLDPLIVYRVVLKTAAGAVLKTWDPANENVLAAIDSDFIGQALYPRTAAEIAAGVMPVNYAYGASDLANVLRYNGVMDDSSASARTRNSAAILTAASANNGYVTIPKGTYWIDGSLDWSALPALILSGAGADLTTIKGDGDLFLLTDETIANNAAPEFRDFSIQNDVTRGKLFSIACGADVNRIKWTRVEFRNANYHIWSSDICVSHLFDGCRFNGAQQASRFYAGLWAMTEHATYSWFNNNGLFVEGDSSSSCNSYGSVYEQHDGSAILISADSGDVTSWNFYGTHFEANGKSAGAADVSITTATANRVRGIRFYGCSWYLPSFGVAQTERIFVGASGGGNIDNVRVTGGYVSGAVPICSNVTTVTVDNDVEFQTPSARPTFTRTDIRVPLSAAGYLGENFTSGANVGSSATVATITPPSGVKVIDFTVQGNIYNGVANSHTGYLIGKYVASGNRIIITSDQNHSAGANQGFVATWTGSALQIANKAAMANNQSGDVECVFHA